MVVRKWPRSRSTLCARYAYSLDAFITAYLTRVSSHSNSYSMELRIQKSTLLPSRSFFLRRSSSAARNWQLYGGWKANT